MAAGDIPGRMPPLQVFEMFGVLAEHGVDYVVIGGYSLAAHGVIRATKDLDIVPAPGRDNLEKLVGALQELDAQPIGVDDFRADELPVRLDLDGLLAGGNWILRTRSGRLDLMQWVAGVRDYESLRAGAVKPSIPGLDPATTPLFAGLDDLVAMKRAAARPQDLLDIAELERAQGNALPPAG